MASRFNTIQVPNSLEWGAGTKVVANGDGGLIASNAAGTAKLTLASSGTATLAGSLIVASTATMAVSSRGGIGAGADGDFEVHDNAATSPASLRFKRKVTAKTSNYPLVALTDCGMDFTNDGASGEVDFTLPTWASGLCFRFYVTTAQILKIIAPASNTIRIAASVSSAAGNINSNTVGNVVELVAVKSNVWLAISSLGTWTFV